MFVPTEAWLEPVTCFSITRKVEQLTPFPGIGLENMKAKIKGNIRKIVGKYEIHNSGKVEQLTSNQNVIYIS